ncbi:YkgJ family cysteine cluster protein [Ramlibacter sp. USB13]|uniref:YkgJ family cysteine cluster protein n=1 Tax=Ramlibacter cellulosilyticus TaxID=2764187 RepID=A0A923MN24_9BURK|nr:YkgJ family cysteine cluster protein [Ramlibacter cellulosilyticus]MBC5782055.1 YkgJ family cysteine cluster protein [Ramlibacter cellulosilyticus]
MSQENPEHPCLRCGACCAAYRVDFSACELLDEGGTVPMGLAVEVTGSTWRMRGTDHQPVRCAALVGKVGERASCGIYEWRPNPCRELEPGSDACEQARARHGLAPVETGML